MNTRLGNILTGVRGSDTRANFARRLELSYTYVRALELGLRSPSDSVLVEIANKLKLDPGELIIAAYCDRSKRLTDALAERGVVKKDHRPHPAVEDEAEEPARVARKSGSAQRLGLGSATADGRLRT